MGAGAYQAGPYQTGLHQAVLHQVGAYHAGAYHAGAHTAGAHHEAELQPMPNPKLQSPHELNPSEKLRPLPPYQPGPQ